MLIYLHFLCIFKLLAADAATLEYAPISPEFAPLRRLIAHMSRTRKWPPSPNSPPVPTGFRSDERAALPRETFLRRDDAHRWARQAESRVDQWQAPTSTSVSRLQTFGDLIDLHITDMCEVGKPPRREPRPIDRQVLIGSILVVRETIIKEIQRLAALNNGQPPGRRYFATETGISDSESEQG